MISKRLSHIAGFIMVSTTLLITGCTNKEPIVFNPATADGSTVSIKDENGPQIKFDKTEFDFGTVMRGERLSYTFVFTNTGKSDLIISSTMASCGCTTTVPPKAPIPPGEKGEIKVTFDSKSKKGPVTNTVTVATNTYPTRTILKLKADVKIP